MGKWEMDVGKVEVLLALRNQGLQVVRLPGEERRAWCLVYPGPIHLRKLDSASYLPLDVNFGEGLIFLHPIAAGGLQKMGTFSPLVFVLQLLRGEGVVANCFRS